MDPSAGIPGKICHLQANQQLLRQVLDRRNPRHRLVERRNHPSDALGFLLCLDTVLREQVVAKGCLASAGAATYGERYRLESAVIEAEDFVESFEALQHLIVLIEHVPKGLETGWQHFQFHVGRSRSEGLEDVAFFVPNILDGALARLALLKRG